jgi:hypothetical protein
MIIKVTELNGNIALINSSLLIKADVWGTNPGKQWTQLMLHSGYATFESILKVKETPEEIYEIINKDKSAST